MKLTLSKTEKTSLSACLNAVKTNSTASSKSYLKSAFFKALVITFIALVPLGIKAQFTCSFSNLDGNIVFPCASVVKATVTLPTPNPMTTITLTFPNSFQSNLQTTGVTFTSPTPIIINPASPPPPINGIILQSEQLLQQTFSIPSGLTSFEVFFSYRNCNVNNETGSVNNTSLYFDCDGGTQLNQFLYSAIITQPENVLTGLDFANTNDLAQANTTTTPTIQVLPWGSNPITTSNSLNFEYDRYFTVVINSLSINDFILSVDDEGDVNESPIQIINAAGNAYSAVYPTYGPNIAINDLTAIQLGGFITQNNNSRTIIFKQHVSLVCATNSNLPSTANVTATLNCAPCSTNVSSTPALILDGEINSAPDVAPQIITLDFNGNACNVNYNYDMNFKITPIAQVELTEISIPINTTAFNVQEVWINTSNSSFQQINNNNITFPAINTPNASIIINVDQIFQPSSTTNWPGFINTAFNLPGAWTNPVNPLVGDIPLTLRVVLNEVLQNTTCPDAPTQLTPLPNDVNNKIKFKWKNACPFSNETTKECLLTNISSPSNQPITSSPTLDFPPNMESGTPTIPETFSCNFNIPAQSPFQISNSTGNPCINTFTYRAVLSSASTNSGGALNYLGSFIGGTINLSHNGFAQTISPEAYDLTTNSYIINLPTTINPTLTNNSYLLDFGLEDIACPNLNNGQGYMNYELTIQAVCNAACPSRVKNLACNNIDVLIHCSGLCPKPVGIRAGLTIERTTAGWVNENSYNNDAAGTSFISDLSGYLHGPSLALNETQINTQLRRVYPYDIFRVRATGDMNYTKNEGCPTCKTHNSLAFELMYPTSNGSFPNLFETVSYTAIFTPLGGSPITITGSQPLSAPQSGMYSPLNAPNYLRKLEWTDAELQSLGIYINTIVYRIDLELNLRVMATTPVSNTIFPIQCQFSTISTGTTPNNNTSCDIRGQNIYVLIPVVTVEQANLQSGPILIGGIGGTGGVNVGSVNSTNAPCQFGSAIGISHSGGNGSFDDFPYEFRPLTKWPNQITATNLIAVNDYTVLSGTNTNPNNYNSNSPFSNQAINNPPLLPTLERVTNTNNHQGLVLSLNKDCPNSSTNVDVNDNFTAPAAFNINRYAYLNTGFGMPSDFNPYITPVAINSVPTGGIPASITCTNVARFPGENAGVINVASGSSFYDFILSMPSAATQGLPLALKMTVIGFPLPLVSLGAFTYGTSTTPLTVTNGWYQITGLPIYNNTLSPNAHLQINVTGGTPAGCLTESFQILFEWKVFCSEPQLTAFVNNTPNATVCGSCSTPKTFQVTPPSLTSLNISNNFSADAPSCQLIWTLTVRNPLGNPAIDGTTAAFDASTLNLNFSTGLIYQNATSNSTPGSSGTLNPTPSFSLEQWLGIPSYKYVNSSLQFSSIHIEPGGTLTIQIYFKLSKSLCTASISNQSKLINTANFDAYNICNHHLENLPINVNVSGSTNPPIPPLSDIIQSLNTANCCMQTPIVVTNICGTTLGSIAIDNPQNNNIEVSLSSNLTSCTACTTATFNTTQFTYSGLETGTYTITYFNQINGAYYSELVNIAPVDLTITSTSSIGAQNYYTACGTQIYTSAASFINLQSINGITTTNLPVGVFSQLSSNSVSINWNIFNQYYGGTVIFEVYNDVNCRHEFVTIIVQICCTLMPTLSVDKLSQISIPSLPNQPAATYANNTYTFTNQTFLINNTTNTGTLLGALECDKNIVFNNCHIALEDSKSIYMDANKSITINNSEIKECFNRHSGIKATAGYNTVQITNTKIRGGNYAVQIANSGTLNISGMLTDFDNNLQHVSANASLVTVSNGNFHKSGLIPPPYTSSTVQPCLLAFNIYNCQLATFDNGVRISDANWGIKAISSGLNCDNSHFENLRQGIYLWNSPIAFLPIDRICKIGYNGPNYFTNCASAIFAGGNLNPCYIRNNTINNSEFFAIKLQQVNNRGFHINNNTISDSRIGIYSYLNTNEISLPFNSREINDNQIFANSSYQHGINANYKGIIIEELVNLNPNYDFPGASIYVRDNIVVDARHGIDLTNCFIPHIWNNHVFVSSDITGIYDSNGNLTDYCNGISLSGCHLAWVTDNKVSSTAPWPYTWANWMQSGIRVAASFHSTICGNEVCDQTLTTHPYNPNHPNIEIGDPFEFLGNCNLTSFKNNYINQSSCRGLYLGGPDLTINGVNGVIIGNQGRPDNAHDNYWNIVPGSWHTDFSNVKGNLNKFFMNPTISASLTHNKITTTSSGNSIIYGFTTDNGSNPNTNCSILTAKDLQEKLDVYDDIARDSIIKLGGTADIRYFGKEFLYAQIKDETDLENIFALYQFKQEADGGNLKYIDEIKRGLKYPIEPAQLTELFNKLGLIVPTNQPEIRYKEVFELALNNPEMRDSVFIPSEIEKLKEIAQLCPLLEGNAVYMARVMLHAVDPYTDYINKCEIVKAPDRKTSERRANNGVSESNIIMEEFNATQPSSYSILPNPSNGVFKLLCKSNSLIYCEITNVAGQIIVKGINQPSNNIIDFNKVNLEKGLYNLKIVDDNETVILKIIIN